MSTPSKLTDREWALVEDVSKEFTYWRRNYATGKPKETYGVRERDLVGLIAIIARLSKEKEDVHVKKTFDIKAYRAKYKDDHKAELLEKKKAYYEKNKERLCRNQREYARKKREAEKIMAQLAEIKRLADDANAELDYCHVTGVVSNDSRYKISGTIHAFETLLVDLLSEKATRTAEPATAGLRRCKVNGQPGIFHRWGDYALSTNADEAHIIKGVIGIVEMADGSITEAHPLSIAFEKPKTTLYCDGKPFTEISEVKEGEEQ